MCTYLQGTKCSPPAPATAPTFIKPTMGVVYGGWELEPIHLPLHEAISRYQSSSRHQIRFAAQELSAFQNVDEIFFFFFFRISSSTISCRRSEGESVKRALCKMATDHFFSTKPSSRSFTLESTFSISTRKISCLRPAFFFFFIMKPRNQRRGKKGRKNLHKYQSIRDEVQLRTIAL